MKADGFIRVLRTIFLILIAVFFCPFACGKIIYVDNDAGADYESIQAGIDAAQNGDTVHVTPGIYYENIALKDGVNLLGAGADLTIIDANGYGDVLDARANDVTISGFTIRNSGQFDLGHMNCGIYLVGSYAPIIRNNVIAHNEIGIGVWDGANPEIRNNIIRNNYTGLYIYGLEEHQSKPAIINNTIVNNEIDGITLRVMVSPVIVNNIITGHTYGINHNYVTGAPIIHHNNLWHNDVNYLRDNNADDTLAGPGSISVDPNFAKPGYWDTNGTPDDPNDDFWVEGDYHLKSQAGRWDPVSESWIQDDVTSPCIDAGDPNMPVGDEPFPNGGIINMGAYGGTPQASKSYILSKIICVDDDAVGNNDGSSWQNAYSFLQDALADANSAEKPVEIHVAQGIYKPDQGANQTRGDRKATFQLINDVTLKGGYVGFGSSDSNERDPELYQTILSGDLDINDVDINDVWYLWDEPTRNENSYNVVTGSSTDWTAVLDGFTISGGSADKITSGSSDEIGSPSVGGGMYNKAGSPTLNNCKFTTNRAYEIAGGMYNFCSNPILTNCTFKWNVGWWLGGGMYNQQSNPTLIDCTFNENDSAIDGGGMYNEISNPSLIRCRFIGNLSDYGSGMFNSNSNPTLNNCNFTENTTYWIAHAYIENPSGGIYKYTNSKLMLNNCRSTENITYGITSNATPSGGGMYNETNSNPILTNCTFHGNKTVFGGGGLYNNNSYVMLTNCTFTGNTTKFDDGGAIYNYRSNSILINCILWSNFPEEVGGSRGNTIVEYTNIRGGWPGEGNIDTDPMFIDATNGDYHLKSQAGRWDPVSQSWVVDDVTSPCIDAGNPNTPVAFEPSPNGGIINMGAYGGTVEASKSPSGLHAKYGGGTGEPNNPYLIYTAEQMNNIGANWDDEHFKLMADIDLDPNLPGCKVFDEAVIGYFKGVFDGNGHKISHLTIEGGGRLGIFNRLASESEVRDLEVVDVNISGIGSSIGGLVGINGGHLVNCFASGTINGTVKEIGGLVGQNYGIVEMCHSTGKVSGKSFVGGLVGENLGYVMVCYSTSDVSGDSQVGGLVGANGTTAAIRGGPSMISDCYSTGHVNASDGIVGGLVGSNKSGSITNCYSTGQVIGNEDIGGLVGLNKDAVIQCFWDIQTSHQTTSAGGIGKTSNEMQMADTFLSWSTCGNEGTWKIDEGNDYPALWWENKTGETIAVGASLSELLAGEGVKENPYLIYTGEELNYIGLFPCDWDKHFKLMANIDLSDFDGREGRPVFNIIGSGRRSRAGVPFTGIFDGNGHTIANFTYTLEGDVESILKEYVENVGLFGCIADANSQIRNLGLVDPNVDGGTEWNVGCLSGCLREGSITGCYVEGGSVKGGQNVGGLIGYNYRGNITTCYSTGISNEADGHVGGLVGYNDEGNINMSYSSGSIKARLGRVGGLVGVNWCGSIATSYSAGSVNSTGSDVGGFVGFNAGGSINMSYSTSIVTGNIYIGGLVGYNDRGDINASYCTGKVTGNETVGGLVGYEYKSNIITSFWNTDTSSQDRSAGGIGKTTAEMQTASTFLEAGWDFVDETANGTEDIWWILEGRDYPRLWWEAE